MTTLEIAPTPEEVVEHQTDDPEIPEMVGHLYGKGSEVAWCGIHRSQDAHVQYHYNTGMSRGQVTVWLGEDQCPICGASLCPTCKEAAPDTPEFLKSPFIRGLMGR